MGIKHAHQTALPDDPTKDVSATNWNADHTIALTKAELNAAVSDGNVQFVGDAPTAHTHPSTEVTGLGTLATQSGTFSGTSSGTNTGDETAAGILAKLITVDGAGSGLDADLLDGQSSAAFATAAQGLLAASASQPGHTHVAGNITDFSAAVAATAAVTANTAKVSNATHTGEVTGSTALTITNDAVTNAKLANMAAATLKGRTTAGTGDPEDLTATQATAMLDAFTASLKGLAPASGGGTSNFLRADGTWAAPAGGGSGATWGGITGTLSSQTDLQGALDGKQPLATVLTNTTASFTTAQETKLSGIAANATANATDAALRDRATHTGTQAANTIIDFDAAVAANAAVTANTAKVTNATHTGDVTGATALTLATVNGNVGSFGLAGSVAQFVVNAKGLITSAVNVAISIAATAISDSTAAGRSMLTAATVAAQTALLDVFSSGAKGLAPASGGGTTNFLRADGTWAAPAAGANNIDGGSASSIYLAAQSIDGGTA